MAKRFFAGSATRRFLTAFGLAAALAALPVQGFAQDRAAPPKLRPPEAPAKLPKVPTDRAKGLDFLFGALKAAPDEDSAKAIEERIWARWMVSGSDTTDLLMGRAKQAIEGGDLDLAIRLLDAVTEIRPKYVEGWNRRATVFFLKKDYTSALVDLRKVLALEPRHFGALAGLGMIMEELGDSKDALAAFRRATDIYPRLKGMDEKIKTLSDKVEGRNT